MTNVFITHLTKKLGFFTKVSKNPCRPLEMSQVEKNLRFSKKKNYFLNLGKSLWPKLGTGGGALNSK